MKSALKTTEFYATLITNVMGLLMLTGALNADEGEEIGNAAKAIAGAVLSIATTLGYIKSRTDVKRARIDAIQDSWGDSNKDGDSDNSNKKREHIAKTMHEIGV